MRDDAAAEFDANQQSDRVLKIIQTLVVSRLIEQSKAFMDKMSESDKEDMEKTTDTDEDLKTEHDKTDIKSSSNENSTDE